MADIGRPLQALQWCPCLYPCKCCANRELGGITRTPFWCSRTGLSGPGAAWLFAASGGSSVALSMLVSCPDCWVKTVVLDVKWPLVGVALVQSPALSGPLDSQEVALDTQHGLHRRGPNNSDDCDILLPSFLRFLMISGDEHFPRCTSATWLVSFEFLCLFAAVPIITQPTHGLSLLPECADSWGSFLGRPLDRAAPLGTP